MVGDPVGAGCQLVSAVLSIDEAFSLALVVVQGVLIGAVGHAVDGGGGIRNPNQAVQPLVIFGIVVIPVAPVVDPAVGIECDVICIIAILFIDGGAGIIGVIVAIIDIAVIRGIQRGAVESDGAGNVFPPIIVIVHDKEVGVFNNQRASAEDQVFNPKITFIVGLEVQQAAVFHGRIFRMEVTTLPW